MGTHDRALFSKLYELATGGQDNADVGEAMGYALGLIMLGSGDIALASEELMKVAVESPHEKVTRAFSFAAALVMYGQEEVADVLIEQLVRDQDAVIRCAGVWTTALAYCGTANNGAVRRCLHLAVSDVSDDVRRIAVSSLGLLLHRHASKVPKLVRLLAESFNAHVRYGSCLATGVACLWVLTVGTP